ncbi:ABC transporter ATP-binding protein [Megasphaera hexanoica]|uniref:ABC transporter ATP-binding protein n=1 Tax=Megasphaera hexanoica TaxID=1675036 RepID=A0A848BXZ5_9FIRM|nr:ABC transporter ATP-binding protein [Megasphaera hexanoica]NME27927.1 ABC transporter ATP-binding protein [Megasphaera hexanoica]
MENAVEIKDVSMRFNLAKERVDNIKEWVVRKLKGKGVSFDEFWALKDISLTIPKGDSFALIGSNGSGKSTLLKIISGVLTPTRGTVTLNGSLAPLIELGAGFDMDLSGRENVFLNGAILGHSKKMMEEKYDEIMDFSELKDFEDVPVKNYSSGMMARLGFSIATLVKPDILIVDEILSVGDHSFQEKCSKRMEEMMSGGTTVILVSHDESMVKKICRHAAWINKGHLMFVGDSEVAVDHYLSSIG